MAGVELQPISQWGQPQADSIRTTDSAKSQKKERMYKVVVIGDIGVGRTNIVKRYVHKCYSPNTRATSDFALKVLNWNESTLIRLQLWEIAINGLYGNMTKLYFKNAVGAFVVFDVTQESTLSVAEEWKNHLDSEVTLLCGKAIPCVLLANKCDVDQPHKHFVHDEQQMDEYCREKGYVDWFKTSAKENINIDEAAKRLLTKIMENDDLMKG
ncbi:ras-related protein Rab-38-like isoform X2 [Oscarella lobularis]|uniref:ras-related protein Rab-38-like isoform X2 n=1 Tax=Oscarella lobularis TaxID=121494 RepID=UPI00331403EB